jgi:hypothetical protein
VDWIMHLLLDMDLDPADPQQKMTRDHLQWLQVNIGWTQHVLTFG